VLLLYYHGTGGIVRCACQGTTGLVGCLAGPRSTFNLPDVLGTAFGWGNASRSDCLAQFYQTRLNVSR
jgi:hypothetical protein